MGTEATQYRSSRRNCRLGPRPDSMLGFAKVKSRLGDIMGVPAECEHGNPTIGPPLQLTSTGLAVYHSNTARLECTDGWRHWPL